MPIFFAKVARPAAPVLRGYLTDANPHLIDAAIDAAIDPVFEIVERVVHDERIFRIAWAN